MLLLANMRSRMRMSPPSFHNQLLKQQSSEKKRDPLLGSCQVGLCLEDAYLRRAPASWVFCLCIMTLLQFCFLTMGTPLVAVISRWKIPGDVFPVFILVHKGWPREKSHYLWRSHHYLWRSHYLVLNLQKRRWERTKRGGVLDTIFPMNVFLESFSFS